MLEGMKTGWTASFLTKLYPELSLYMIMEFVGARSKLSIVVILALFVSFGAENFQKKHAVLLTVAIQNLDDCDDLRQVRRVRYPDEIPWENEGVPHKI